jgi:hypothetical protein
MNYEQLKVFGRIRNLECYVVFKVIDAFCSVIGCIIRQENCVG